MKNRMVLKPLQFVLFSLIFLSFFSFNSANEEWQNDNCEINFYDFSSLCVDAYNLTSFDFTHDKLLNQNELEEAVHWKKLKNKYNSIQRQKKPGPKQSRFSQAVRPYLLPADHPAKKILDFIFTQSTPTTDLDAMTAAGFNIVSVRPYSFAVIARHPDLPGYIQKLYLDSEQRKKNGKEGWEWLVQRCIGAENIRKLIRKEKLKYFSVPDKWIYVIPSPKGGLKRTQQLCILLVTDMELVSDADSMTAWKLLITPAHLDELYIILSHGFASSHVSWNIPYSKTGKFACIDTEHPKRIPNYVEVESYLSDEMKEYWKNKVNSKGQ